MADFSNYGVTISRAGAGLAGIVNIDMPEMAMEAIETTAHDSGGWRTFIGSGLKELSEFTITVSYQDGESFSTDMLAGTSRAYVITFPNTVTWSFSGLVTKVKPSDAEASSPEELLLEVTFQPSGTTTIA